MQRLDLTERTRRRLLNWLALLLTTTTTLSTVSNTLPLPVLSSGWGEVVVWCRWVVQAMVILFTALYVLVSSASLSNSRTETNSTNGPPK